MHDSHAPLAIKENHVVSMSFFSCSLPFLQFKHYKHWSQFLTIPRDQARGQLGEEVALMGIVFTLSAPKRENTLPNNFRLFFFSSVNNPAFVRLLNPLISLLSHMTQGPINETMKV